MKANGAMQPIKEMVSVIASLSMLVISTKDTGTKEIIMVTGACY